MRLRTVGVQHAWDVEVLLCNVEGRVEVLQRVVLRQLVVVDEIRTMSVDQGAERQAVLEADDTQRHTLETR